MNGRGSLRTPDGPLLLLVTSQNGPHNAVKAFGVTEENALTTPWRNGFSTSVEQFFVGEDESLTVFGLEATTRGDVVSLRSAPVHPLSRRASTSQLLTLVYDAGEFAGAIAPVSYRTVGSCADCARRGEWSPVASVVEFLPVVGLSTWEVVVEGTGENEASRGFTAISVRGARAATWSETERRLSLFDLAPDTPLRSPQKISSFTITEIDANQVDLGPALTLHADDRATIAFLGSAVLVDLSASPPEELAHEPLPSLGEGHSFLAAWASAEHWLVLVSGGTWQNNSTAAAAVLRRTSMNGSEPVQVELPADAEPSRFAYRAHILGVVDGVVYVGHTRKADDGPRHEVLLYAFDDLAAGPFHVVSLESEIVGMHVLDDGALLIAREDGFTFLTPQCTEQQ